jgi:hypothetical protein
VKAATSNAAMTGAGETVARGANIKDDWTSAQQMQHPLTLIQLNESLNHNRKHDVNLGVQVGDTLAFVTLAR